MEELNAPVTTDTAPTETPTETTPENWYDSLPDEYKSNPNVTKYKSQEELLNGHINLTKKIGEKGLTKPETDEDWKKAYAFLGKPETIEGYEFTPNEELPDELKLDEQMATSFKEVAHEIGLNPHQYEKLMSSYMAMNEQGFKARKEQMDAELLASEKELKETWGQAYDQNIEMARNIVKKYDNGGKLTKLLETPFNGSSLGNNPVLLNMLANVAKSTMEDGGLVGRGAGIPTSEDLETELGKLINHPAYLDGNNPEHKQIAKQVSNIYKKLYPQ